MKYPLQASLTPYEIRGIAPGCSTTEINEAFRAGLVRRANVQKLTHAKQTLERPQERALVDLFLYDDTALTKLEPNVLQNPNLLGFASRHATAQAWEAQCRRTFPDLSVIHCLAVLWYWWAVSESERLAADETRDPRNASSWEQRWQAALGYGVMLMTHPDFWRSRTSVPAEVRKDLQTAVIRRLASDLQRFKQQHSERRNTPVADRFQALEISLETEQKTAKALLAANISANRRPVCCGRLLLTHLNFLDKVRGQVDTALANKPNDKALLALQEELSPYGHIAALIGSQRLEAAIEAIRKLPLTERNTREVRKLESRAWFERGKQQRSLDKIYEALDYWSKAAASAETNNERRLIHDEVESACLHITAGMHDAQREEAIRILEKGLLNVSHSQQLSLKLAGFLTDRGILAIKEAQKLAETTDHLTQNIKDTFRRGIADLDRAKILGELRAAEQVKTARDIQEQYLSGNYWIGVKFGPLLEKADQAMERKDWDMAIQTLEEATEVAYPSIKLSRVKEGLASLPEFVPAVLKQRLAVAYNTRGNAKANKAIQLGQRTAGVELLEEARKDFSVAYRIDPNLQVARENEEQITQILTTGTTHIQQKEVPKRSSQVKT